MVVRIQALPGGNAVNNAVSNVVNNVAGERTRTRTTLPSTDARAPDVTALRDFAELIAASARSPHVRERIGLTAGAPITGASLVALRIIARSGQSTPSQVARRLGLDLSTASRQIRPLEKNGLVSRTIDALDRRVSVLSLTDEGHAVLARVDDVICDSFDTALQDWSPAERATFAELVSRLHQSLLEG
jgi:DNA-binding MarR family transcriptional regulator